MKTPENIDRQALIDAFAMLGLSIRDTTRVVITPHEMTLTYVVRDADNRKVMAGDDLATAVVKIGTP